MVLFNQEPQKSLKNQRIKAKKKTTFVVLSGDLMVESHHI